MPADTDLNCTCAIQSYTLADDVLLEGQLDALHLELIGSVSDPCRERLVIEGNLDFASPWILCPDDPDQGFKYTRINETLSSIAMFRKEIVAEIHLVTNKSTGSDTTGKFLFRLSSQGR